MKRRIFGGAVLAAVLMLVSCSREATTYGTIGLDASNLARYVVETNAAAVNGASSSESILTESDRNSLYDLMKTGVNLHFELFTTGSFEGTAEYDTPLAVLLEKQARGSDDTQEFNLKLKKIPVGSTITIHAKFSIVYSNEYKAACEKIQGKYIEMFINDMGLTEAEALKLVRPSILEITAGLNDSFKYEGQTQTPVKVRAGNNKAEIVLEQTGGFTAGGDFEIELADDQSLGLIVENIYDEEDEDEDGSTEEVIMTIIKLSDSNYQIFRVEYSYNEGGMTNKLILDLNNNTIDSTGENGQYRISIDENKITMTLTEDWADLQEFFYHRSFLIIAKHKTTGIYKTAVYAGL